MKVYTSYFANGKKLKKAGVKMVGVALYPPQWYYGLSLKELAPTYSILNEQDVDVYTARYKREVLGRLNPNEVLRKLQEVSGGRDIALCCFEKPDDFCHRHLLADWLNEKLNLGVEEFGKSKEPKYKQLSLFDM